MMEIFFYLTPGETMIRATSRTLFWAAVFILLIGFTRWTLGVSAIDWFEVGKLTLMSSISFRIACFLE